MSTRKRKQEDEELVALPSDVSEDEEEYVPPRRFPFLSFNSRNMASLEMEHHLCRDAIQRYATTIAFQNRCDRRAR